MKLIISLLMVPVIIALGLNALITGFVWLVLNNPEWIAGDTPATHTLKGCVYAAVGSALPLAVAIAVICAALVAASFIFKSWSQAIFTGLAGAAAVVMWLYLLNITYPL